MGTPGGQEVLLPLQRVRVRTVGIGYVSSFILSETLVAVEIPVDWSSEKRVRYYYQGARRVLGRESSWHGKT